MRVDRQFQKLCVASISSDLLREIALVQTSNPEGFPWPAPIMKLRNHIILRFQEQVSMATHFANFPFVNPQPPELVSPGVSPMNPCPPDVFAYSHISVHA